MRKNLMVILISLFFMFAFGFFVVGIKNIFTVIIEAETNSIANLTKAVVYSSYIIFGGLSFWKYVDLMIKINEKKSE